MPMIRWSTAIVLAAVLATGCRGGAAQPTSPSATSTQPSPIAPVTVTGVVRDLLEAMGPVMAPAGEDLDGSVPKMDLDAVAVELDLVNPALAGWHPA